MLAPSSYIDLKSETAPTKENIAIFKRIKYFADKPTH
jgi:hypothetical protein